MKVMQMKCKSMKVNIISLAILAVLSAATVFAGFYLKKTGSEASAYIFGVFTGLTAVAVGQTVRIIKMLKNAKYRKEQEIAQKDERLISINNRSMAVSYRITILATTAASIISAAASDMKSASNFSLLLCISSAVYLIAYLVLSHKE